jgi:electron transport complex protein RnfB
MHTVLAAACTGCELCLPPCPVDCITLHTAEQPQDCNRDGLYRFVRRARKQRAADLARARYEFRLVRLARAPDKKTARRTDAARLAPVAVQAPEPSASKQALIAAAVARAAAKKAARQRHNPPPAA